MSGGAEHRFVPRTFARTARSAVERALKPLPGRRCQSAPRSGRLGLALEIADRLERRVRGRMARQLSMQIMHMSMKIDSRKRKETKAKLLSFAFISFSESGLFNELRPIQAKKCAAFCSRCDML
jgi:hypothetical protein